MTPRYGKDALIAAAVLAGVIIVHLLLAPTAFRIDEPNILSIARQILDEPLDPYGFGINWNVVEQPAFEVLANPPLVPYWLAVWSRVFGWSEISLHLAMLPFMLAVITGVGRLAHSLGLPAGGSMLLAAGSPGLLVASHVVMPDIAALALLLWAAVGAILYSEAGHRRWFVTAVLCGFAAPLAKYNAIIVIPPLVLMVFLHGSRRVGIGMIATAPVLGLTCWSLVSWFLYGDIHFLSAARFQSGWKFPVNDVLSAFGLGLLPLAAALAPARLSLRREMPLLVVSSALFLAIAFMNGWQGWQHAAIFSFAATLSLRFLGNALTQVLGGDDRRSVVLVVWLVFGLALQFTALFTAVRYMLPLLPAAIMFAMRSWSPRYGPRFYILAGVSVLLSLGVAVSDAATANLYRRVVKEQVAPAASERPIYFAGHWGLQYYLEMIGAEAIDGRQPGSLPARSLVVIAEAPFPQVDPQVASTFWEGAGHRQIQIQPRSPLRSVSCDASVNIHAPGVGTCPKGRAPLVPFGFSQAAADTIHLFDLP